MNSSKHGAPKKPRTQWASSPRIAVRPDAVQAFATASKLDRLIAALGSNGTALVLGVDRSRLNRLVSGKETTSAELARRISDVEYVLERALATMPLADIGPWLTAPEPLLNDRIPLKILMHEGPGPLVNTLEAIYGGVLA